MNYRQAVEVLSDWQKDAMDTEEGSEPEPPPIPRATAVRNIARHLIKYGNYLHIRLNEFGGKKPTGKYSVCIRTQGIHIAESHFVRSPKAKGLDRAEAVKFALLILRKALKFARGPEGLPPSEIALNEGQIDKISIALQTKSDVHTHWMFAKMQKPDEKKPPSRDIRDA